MGYMCITGIEYIICLWYVTQCLVQQISNEYCPSGSLALLDDTAMNMPTTRTFCKQVQLHQT